MPETLQDPAQADVPPEGPDQCLQGDAADKVPEDVAELGDEVGSEAENLADEGVQNASLDGILSHGGSG